MADAKKCDRCGKLYEWYCTEYDGTDINGAGLFRDRQYSIFYDLCPECLEELIEWIERCDKEGDEK